MLKISFWLKKPDNIQGNLECITIASPKKSLEGSLAGNYVCEVYLSNEKKNFPIYSINPVDVVYFVSEFVRTYLQGLVYRGFTISEAEKSQEPWRLERKDPQLILQEKIDEIKNNKDISLEDKQKS